MKIAYLTNEYPKTSHTFIRREIAGIMQALALRRPVICTTVGGVAELVTHGECGWLVGPGSEIDLAAAMHEALTCLASELDKMGQSGARRIAAEHDSRAQAQTMTELFLAAKRAPQG